MKSIRDSVREDEIFAVLNKKFNHRMKIELLENEKRVLDDKGARILSAIRGTGSLTESARITGVSFRGLWNYIRNLETQIGARVVETLSGGSKGGSSVLTLLGESLLEDYLVIRRRADQISATEGAKTADLTIIGSHCPVVELLVGRLRSQVPEVSIKLVGAGSLVGLLSLRMGLAEIAGFHFVAGQHEPRGEAVREEVEKVKNAVLVKGYRRVQGLMVRSGNPKAIGSPRDLLKKGVVFINRNVGSGTRTLFEVIMEGLARERNVPKEQLLSSVKCYGLDARSHDEVAMTISNGKAHVGIGLECVATKYGLGFIPMAREDYEFLVRRESLDGRPVKDFLKELRSDRFRRSVLDRLRGIEFTQKTGRVVRR